MKKFALIAGACAILLTACATPPERIAAVPNVGPCTAADQQRLAILSNKQTQTANNDALGVFLIGVPIGSMGGGDNEAEIAILKGRCQGAAPRMASPAVRRHDAPPPGAVVVRN